MAKYVKAAEQLCHISPKEVMTIGKTPVVAGKWTSLSGLIRPRLLINPRALSYEGTSVINSPFVANEAARQRLPKALTTFDPPPVLTLDWPDFGAPPLDDKWWKTLVNWIKSGKPEGPIGVGCAGGHGRTGTTLAILASLSGAAGSKDPVLWVRQRYCHKAVETDEQLDYIEDITGVQVGALASEHFSPPVGTTTSHSIPPPGGAAYGDDPDKGFHEMTDQEWRDYINLRYPDAAEEQ